MVAKKVRGAEKALAKKVRAIKTQVKKGSQMPADAWDGVVMAVDTYYVECDSAFTDGIETFLDQYDAACDGVAADDPVCDEIEPLFGTAATLYHNAVRATLAACGDGADRAFDSMAEALACKGYLSTHTGPGPTVMQLPAVAYDALAGLIPEEFRLALTEVEIMNITATCEGSVKVLLRGPRSRLGGLTMRLSDGSGSNCPSQQLPEFADEDIACVSFRDVGDPGSWGSGLYDSSGIFLDGMLFVVPAWPEPVTCPAAPTLNFMLDGQSVVTPPVPGVTIRVDAATNRIETLLFATETPDHPRLTVSMFDAVGGADAFLSGSSPAVLTLPPGTVNVFYGADATTSTTSTTSGTFRLVRPADLVNNPTGCIEIVWTGGNLGGVPATATLVAPVTNVEFIKN